MAPNEPQSLPQLDELTLAVRTSLGSSSVTAMFSVTGVPADTETVGWVGEMLTTGPAAGVIVKVSESEVPFTVTATVTELGVGGAGGAR